jgi:predicted outer membrane protein
MNFGWEMNLNQQNLVAKLNQIVEQAQLTLQEPRSLITERQKMIIALARFISSEMSHAVPAQPEPDWQRARA